MPDMHDKPPPLPVDKQKPPIDKANHPERVPLGRGTWADLKALQRGSAGAGRTDAPGAAKDTIAQQLKNIREQGPGPLGRSLGDSKDAKAPATSDSSKPHGTTDQVPAANRPGLSFSVKDSINDAKKAELTRERQERINGPGVAGFPTGSDRLKPTQFSQLENSVREQLNGQALYGNDKIHLTLTGSTSATGDAVQNAQLCKSRAENTAEQFRDRGFTGTIDVVPHLSENKDRTSDDPMERYVEVKATGDDTNKPVQAHPADDKPVVSDKPVSDEDFKQDVSDAASLSLGPLGISLERAKEVVMEASADTATSLPAIKALFAYEGPLALLGELAAEESYNVARGLANEKASMLLKESRIKEAVMSNVGAGLADGIAKMFPDPNPDNPGIPHGGSSFDANSPLYLEAVKLGAASVAGWSEEARERIRAVLIDPRRRADFLHEVETTYSGRLNLDH
jgi:outer membrane protein OmpA-like peptidoglycan-associated protein